MGKKVPSKKSKRDIPKVDKRSKKIKKPAKVSKEYKTDQSSLKKRQPHAPIKVYSEFW